MIHEEFDSKKQVLFTTINKSITIEEIATHYRYLRRNKQLPGNLKVLIDASNASIQFNVEDIREMERAVKFTKLKFESVREAIIVAKDFETPVKALEYMLTKGNFTFRSFQNKQEAMEWLQKRSD